MTDQVAHNLRDWSTPRSARGFVGCAKDGGGGEPSGTYLMCVANTRVPCKQEVMGKQKVVSLTVIGVKKTGWSYAPWKKAAKNQKKVASDVKTQPLFEVDSWVRDDGTGDRVIKGVKVFSYTKEGKQDKGPRSDDLCSVVEIGQVRLVRVFLS